MVQSAFEQLFVRLPPGRVLRYVCRQLLCAAAHNEGATIPSHACGCNANVRVGCTRMPSAVCKGHTVFFRVPGHAPIVNLMGCTVCRYVVHGGFVFWVFVVVSFRAHASALRCALTGQHPSSCVRMCCQGGY